MKITNWLGWNEDASQYVLRPGELRVLNNMQSRRPGMLICRKGLIKIYGLWDEHPIYGLYRRATIFGTKGDFLWLQKVRVERELTAEQIAEGVWPYKYEWSIRRIEGDESRIIDTVELPEDGTLTVKNFCVSEDRHGRMFIFYGHGESPRLYRPDSLASFAIPMGISAPKAAPKIQPSGSGLFIETVDVDFGGGSHSDAPDITISGGGTPDRSAKLKAIVQNGNVVGVDVIDGGLGYTETPELAVSTEKMGSGFRAKGIPTTAASTTEGFSPSAIQTYDDGRTIPDDETYGTKDGTEDQYILYYDKNSESKTATVKFWERSRGPLTGTLAVGGSNYFPVTDTTGINVGDIVRWRHFKNSDGTQFDAASGWYTVIGIHPDGTGFLTNHPGGTLDGQYTTIYEFWTNRIVVDAGHGFSVGDSIKLDQDQCRYTGSEITSADGTINGWAGPSYLSWNKFPPYITDISDDDTIITLSRWFRTPAVHQVSQFARTTTPGYVDRPEIRTGETGVKRAKAKYDKDRRRFTANIPLRVEGSTGEGAFAACEFSPLPLGYMLDTGSNSSKGFTDTGLDQYDNIVYGEGSSRSTRRQKYLYGTYWQGADFDVKKSAENRRYGGLQASGTRMIKGFSGSIDGRSADVYWPDYSAISVWFNTGVYTDNPSQWSREDVKVSSENGAKYIEFDLKPARSAKTVTEVGRDQSSTEYENATELPDATPPRVRVYLNDCPDSWVVADSECRPFNIKESKGNRLPWWSSASGVPRPLVDIPRDESGEISADSVQIVEPGNGWAGGTQFSFRLYQANSYHTFTDFNTAVREQTVAQGHPRYSATDRYVEFRLTANVADENTPHGPPHTLIRPAFVAIAGTGYSAGDFGAIFLASRKIGKPATAENLGVGPAVGWYALVLETLSSASDKKIAAITVTSTGRNYSGRPKIFVRGGGEGYGLSVTPKIENGQIVEVKIDDPGVGYTSSPELYTSDRAAALTPVMRKAMRGIYRCAYRFVDRTETAIKTVSVFKGESETTLTVDDPEGIEPGMMIEGDVLPDHCRIKSVNGDQLEINRDIPDLPERRQATWTAVDTGGVITSWVVVLSAGQRIEPGYAVVTQDKEYQFLFDTDGTLVVSRRVELGKDYTIRGLPTIFGYAEEIWRSGNTGDAEVYAEFDEDGRLTIYSNDGTDLVRWQAESPGSETLEMASTGTLRSFTGTARTNCIIRDLTKPITYSDLSPIEDVDAGPNEKRDGCSKMEWALEGVDPPDRCDRIELWRTSADQSLVFYRCEAYAVPSANGATIVGEDTLTDEELFDPDRPNYAALPIVLPSGALNAYRFGQPRDDLEVGVAWQDRLWMGVSTSGEQPNTLYYSEFDEFESCPDINELPIQNNTKSTDVITALVPFGSILLAVQHTHTYAVTYNTDPAVDATIQMISHRGALHQRAWDIHENIFYAADESGIYSMTRNGEVRDISMPIRDYFVSELIDFSKRDTFFLQVDPRTHILRFFTTLIQYAEETPSFALCYDIQSQHWWTESYPNSFTAACTGRPGATRLNTILLGAVDGNLYEIEGDCDHANNSLTDTFVDVRGSGYREAPEISAPNLKGAIVKGVVSEGALVDVVIQNAGWDARYGIQLLTEDGDKLAEHSGAWLQGAEYAPIQLNVGPPSEGGQQAIAYANFSQTPTIRRFATVAVGESFVRLEGTRVSQFEPDYWSEIATEDGHSLSYPQEDEAGDVEHHILRTQPPVVEVGMEAIGDFVPLNSFVSRVDRNDVYLVHEDGTPVSILHGLERFNQPGTNTNRLELGGTRILVKFRKPTCTHIPFRIQTGFMQVINQENAKGGDSLVDRSVTVVYQPTYGEKELEIIERFNGREEMRPNAMRRDRGGPASFHHRQDSASTVLNMDREASALGFATGVARATYASRANVDATGTDQHLQVELYGRPGRSSPWDRVNFWKTDPNSLPPLPCVIHQLTVNGVVDENG